MQSPNDQLVAYPFVVPRFDGVTLRQSVRLRCAGSALRVWLSNEHGCLLLASQTRTNLAA